LFSDGERDLMSTCHENQALPVIVMLDAVVTLHCHCLTLICFFFLEMQRSDLKVRKRAHTR
jgi:hypothetical protein